MSELSNRGKEWMVFSESVLEHIENYTVPQYGDAPTDLVETWSPDQCVLAIEKYCRRFKKNSREGQDLLDLKKIAHFACIAYGKEIK